MLTTTTRTAAATIDRKALSAALKGLAKVTEKRCTIPIAKCVLVEVSAGGRVTLTATDMDMTMARDVPAQDCAAGQMLAGTHALRDAVAKMRCDAVRMVATPTGLILSGPGGADAIALTADKSQPSDWPTIRAAAADAFTMEAAAMRDDFTRVVTAVSSDPTRYYLCGIFLHLSGGALVSVATNGHTLVKAARPAPVELDDDAGALAKGVIVPTKAIDAICAAIGTKPAGMVGLAVDDQRFTFTAPGIVIIGKLIDGTFPAYHRVIPAAAATGFTVDADALDSAMARLMLNVPRKEAAPIHFNATGEGLTMATRQDGAALIESIDAHGGGMRIGLNGRYLRDMAGTVFAGGDMIVTHSGGGTDAVLLMSNARPDTVAVIMPHKVEGIAPLSAADVRALYGMAEPEEAPTAPITAEMVSDAAAAPFEPEEAPTGDPTPVHEATAATNDYAGRLVEARKVAAAALEAAGVAPDAAVTDAIWRRFMADTLGIADAAAWSIETGRRQADRKLRNRGATLIAHSYYEAMRDDFNALAPLQPCPAPEPAQPVAVTAEPDAVTLAALLARIEALEARQHSPARPSGRAPRAAAHVAAIRAAVRARAQRDAARQDAAQARANEAATVDQLRAACDRHGEALANAETLRDMLTVAEGECERLRTEQRDMRAALAAADARAATDKAELARLAPLAAVLASLAPAAA